MASSSDILLFQFPKHEHSHPRSPALDRQHAALFTNSLPLNQSPFNTGRIQHQDHEASRTASMSPLPYPASFLTRRGFKVKNLLMALGLDQPTSLTLEMLIEVYFDLAGVFDGGQGMGG